MAPASVLPPGGTSLLEREAQVAALEALAGAARSGGGRFAVIEGSAGIGKTRLLAEARAIAGAAGMRVLAARGGEFEGEFAYGIVRQLFEPLLASAAPELRAELLAGPAALMEPLFGAPQPAASEDAPPAEGSFAILHGLYWLAANVALHQPSLLAIDDLHWADTPSLRWLLYLTRRLEGVPLLVAAATRPPEGEGRDPTLVAELIADPEAAAIRPGPLGPASIAVLARELHGLEPDAAFCAALQTATGGNPLFIGAVLDAVAREGTSPTAEQVPRLLEIGAQGVARAVGLRLARLPPEALALLRAAAILGDGAELRHAAALAGLEARELGPAAAIARSARPRSGARIRSSSSTPSSAAPSTRRSTWSNATPPTARPPSCCSRPARRLRARPGTCSASPRGPTRSWSRRSARRPSARSPRARPRPRSHISAARSRSGSIRRRGPRCWSSSALRSGARTARPRPTTCAPVSSSSPTRRGAARSRSSWAARSGSRTGSGTPLRSSSRRSTRSIGGAIRTSTSCSLAELISSAWWDAQTYPIAEAAIGELDLDGLHGGLGSEILLGTMAHYEYQLGHRRERAIELARRALAPGNLLASGSIAFYYAAMVLPQSGLLDEAVSIFDQAVAQARRRGDIFNVAFMLMWRGYCQTRRGDLRAAVADLREALDLCVAHGMLVAWPYNIAFLAHALLEQGEADEAARVIDEGGFPEQLPLGQVPLVWFRLSRGRLRIETGSPERGIEELLQVGETARLVPFDNPSGVPWRRWAAEGLRLLDRNDEARALAEEELALARRWGDPYAIGASLRALGLVEGGEAGIGLLREAVEVLAGSEARLEHARALVDLGAALRRANRRTEARERLREGVDLARRVGALGLAERANEEIAATGARPRRVLRTGLDALTASERRVAQLAADGMTNKEIAQALFVTIKTVEVHLSDAYRKLEISSRAQLDKALATPAPSPAAASA